MYYDTKSKIVFRSRIFPKARAVLFITVCLFTFIVMSFVQNFGKHTSVDTHQEFISKNETFNEKISARTTAIRKLLAEHGMKISDSEGTYQRIVLISTWRSGSTFTGELLSKIPGAVYNFEPLRYIGTRDIPIDDETLASKHVANFNQLLECDYTSLLEHNEGFNLFKYQFLQRNGGYKMCTQIETGKFCQRPEHLSQACRYFPVQITKFVRMPLRYVIPSLRRRELNLHVILLVRDPRGTMASRREVGWCTRDCADPAKLCNLLRDNYETALRAAKEFPGQFTVLRYEDIALDPENGSNALLKRLGIPVTPSIGEYIQKHAGSSVKQSGETFRVRGSRVTRWKQTLPWKDVQHTQNVCQDVLDKYGYVPVPIFDALSETQTFRRDWKLPLTVQ